jgi:hypothetical protein
VPGAGQCRNGGQDEGTAARWFGVSGQRPRAIYFSFFLSAFSQSQFRADFAMDFARKTFLIILSVTLDI